MPTKPLRPSQAPALGPAGLSASDSPAPVAELPPSHPPQDAGLTAGNAVSDPAQTLMMPPAIIPALSALLERSGTYVYAKDLSGRYTYVNKQVQELFGAPLERIVGRPDDDFFGPDLAGLIRDHEARVLEDGIARSGQERGLVLAQSATRTYRSVRAPMRDFKNNIVGVCGISTDVTEHVLLETKILESEYEFCLLAETIPEMVWVETFRDNYIFFNQKWLTYTGRSLQESAASGWKTSLHPDDQEQANRAWTLALETHQGFLLELRFRRANGAYRWWHLRAVPAFDIKNNIYKWFFCCTDIHELKVVEESLRQNQELFKSIIDSTPSMIFAFDLEHRFTLANRALANFYGLNKEAFIGKTLQEMQTRGADRILAFHQDILTKGEAVASEELFESQGVVGPRLMMTVKFPLRDDRGTLIGLGGVSTDITDLRQAEEHLRIAATAFESQEGMVVTDSKFRVLKVNKSFTRITGFPGAEMVGQTPELLYADQEGRLAYQRMWEVIRVEGYWEGEVKNQRKNGEIYPQHLTVTAVKDPKGGITNYVLTMSDITTRKAAEKEIQRLAFYDPLTGLPNRRFLAQRLTRGFASGTRSREHGALLFIDLDNFKLLNDSRGHTVGDLLLQQVAQRLLKCVREGDIVARLGGDEFLVILTDLSAQALEAGARAEAVGEKILASLDEPYELDSHQHHSTASIGITLFRENQAEFNELLKQADISMYQAKHEGRNRLRFFDHRMQEAIAERAELERDLREAIKQNQFELYFQLQMDQRRKAFGAEALIRWNHPTRGLVGPASFIQLAEETGLVLPIGRWVLEQACAQLGAWQKTPRTQDLLLSVNVSARQFRQPDFVAQVQAAIQLHTINAHRLKLELTESVLLENIEEATQTMETLRESGVRFSLDDFGTGYSSLRYLKKLPIDQLKIDQSFVRDITVNSQDRAMVRTIIAMASNLGVDCIAEGVETEDEHQLLLEDGCQYFQGHLFGLAQPLAVFETALGVSHP